jgi:hypothetical protein
LLLAFEGHVLPLWDFANAAEFLPVAEVPMTVWQHLRLFQYDRFRRTAPCAIGQFDRLLLLATPTSIDINEIDRLQFVFCASMQIVAVDRHWFGSHIDELSDF